MGEIFAVDGVAGAACQNAKKRYGAFAEPPIAASEKRDELLGIDLPATVALLGCEPLHGRQTAREDAREQGVFVCAGKEGRGDGVGRKLDAGRGQPFAFTIGKRIDPHRRKNPFDPLNELLGKTCRKAHAVDRRYTQGVLF